MTAFFANAKDNLRTYILSTMGRNPYKEGTMGSYSWKEKRGLPLSEEEKSFHAMAGGISKLLEPQRNLQEAVAHVGLIGQLIDDLPRPMRERFNRLPLDKAMKESDRLLRMSEYERGQKTVALADRALKISVLAFSISVMTLGVSVCTLYVTLLEKA